MSNAYFKRFTLLLFSTGCLIILLTVGCSKKSESGSTSNEPTSDSGTGSRRPRWASELEFGQMRSIDQNNLKQIGMAIHMYVDSNKGILPPAAICDAKGKPLLSWRVAILPFIEQQSLYQMFKLDEPWDSENNKKLIPMMPKTYLLPGSGSENDGLTHYRVFAGIPRVAGANVPMFDWPDPQIAAKARQQQLHSVTDGLSNTIMVAEAEQVVEWTKPDELLIDPKKPVPKLGYFWKERSHVLLGDGSVRGIGLKLSEKALRVVIGRQDGEVVPIDF